LRLRTGTTVRLFDGEGNEFEAILDRITRQGVEVHVGGPVATRPESPLLLTLAISPLKGDLMEHVIQKATELGVASILPVVMNRTDTAGRPALEGSRQERWEKVASSAAEQSWRATVPRIERATSLANLARPAEGSRIVCVARGGLPPFTELQPPLRTLTVLVGPAGGIDDAEVESLVSAGFAVASLGGRVLRAETAAIAAVVAAQLLWGDMGRR
jgi:16S rRNA (uracil1498-N3)-methyltransferase